jgi:hypothetical protein
MQRGLIDHRAGYDRIPVVLESDGHAPEPIRPPAIEVSFDANFVPVGSAMALICVCSLHGPEDSDAGGEASSPHVVIDVVILGDEKA